MGPLEIVYEDETSRQGYSRNLHVVVWYDAPTAEQMHEFGRRAEAIRERNPDGTGLMNLVVSGTPRFGADVREAAREHTERGIHNIGAAHVILVEGLLASAVRGFLGTIVLLGRPKNPTKVFATIDDAARWMTGNCAKIGGQTWGADELAALCGHAIQC